MADPSLPATHLDTSRRRVASRRTGPRPWALLAALASQVSPALAQTPLAEGEFREHTGAPRNADAAYERLHDTGEPAPWRAAGEMLIMLSFGTSWYWSTREDNVRDWDDTDLAGRLNGDAWSIDNNGLDVNFLFHSMSGTAYYGVARANHLPMPVAYAYAFTTSLMWDMALEFNERISISDVLVTPSAGLAIGEYMHKLSWYLNGVPRRPSTSQRVLRYSPIGASVALHRGLDGAPDPAPRHMDALGYDADLWHRFEFDYRLARVNATGQQEALQHAVGHRGRLVALPGFLRPGRHARFFANADFSTLELRGFGSEHGAGFDLQAEAMLLGWFQQSLDEERDGLASVVGLNLAHRYFNSQTTGLHEFYGALRLPGPGAELWAAEGPIRLHVTARAQFDFAGIGSPAYPAWREANPRVRTKNVLTKQKYYVGWGHSLRLGGELDVGPAQVHWRTLLSNYDSQEGLDRAQEEVEVDLDGKDSISEWTLGASLALLDVERGGLGARLGGELGQRHWYSRAGEFRQRTASREASVGVTVTF